MPIRNLKVFLNRRAKEPPAGLFSSFLSLGGIKEILCRFFFPFGTECWVMTKKDSVGPTGGLAGSAGGVTICRQKQKSWHENINICFC